MPETRILWFRQDLRLTDNPALAAALADNARIAPIYILADTIPWPPGGASRWWLHHSLTSLAASLAKRGATLILRRGNPAEILPALAEHLSAQAIHAGIAHEPAWRQTDTHLAAALAKSNRHLVLHRTATLIDPDRIRSQTNTIYGMYTPFARAVEAAGEPPHPSPAPTRIPSVQAPSDTLADWHLLPTNPDWSTGFTPLWRPGEKAATARLAHFTTNAVAAYATGRNLPGEDGTSMLSPHLHWGELSPRTVWHASRTDQDTPDHHTYRRELIWRDFSAYLLWHHPTLPEAPLRPAFAKLAFRQAPKDLKAWHQGRTGIPIVDAGMRQLWQTGWMHNRVRMIAASFLVKHLLISWQAKARPGSGTRWWTPISPAMPPAGSGSREPASTPSRSSACSIPSPKARNSTQTAPTSAASSPNLQPSRTATFTPPGPPRNRTSHTPASPSARPTPLPS